MTADRFGVQATLKTSQGNVSYWSLPKLQKQGFSRIEKLPMTVKVFLENVLRQLGGGVAREEDVKALAGWDPKTPGGGEFPFLPARVVLQDFTGVPAVVDLAAMRAAMQRMGGDPERVNPLAPADLVIDHSVQVDAFGNTTAFKSNVEMEYRRNRERYILLRWGQRAFRNFRVVPPGTGIVHQVNLEYLATVVQTQKRDGQTVAYPDTLVGTDSHTTMINGLGVLGWGVGGIEAEANLLGQPLFLLQPEVIGLRLKGSLREGATATDLVLTITELLRKHGVVEKFVEFFGPGVGALGLPDRATISNMCPEYGATSALFPIDSETLKFLRGTGRDASLVDLVERYAKEQGLFHSSGSRDPEFSAVLELDLATVEPSLAGPRRPQDRVALRGVKQNFHASFKDALGTAASPVEIGLNGHKAKVGHGSVAIAAITSCTNTSNPSVMLGAGILAKKAVERGLTVSPHIKTSLAPGSTAVIDYLKRTGLLSYLERLNFYLVGFGCTTCIGNSGPLPQPVAEAVDKNKLVVAAVLSGNRNFEGRIHPQVRAAYLASPPLVVAYALAGTVDIDLTTEPIGQDGTGKPVYLRDIWPTDKEIKDAIRAGLSAELFKQSYAKVFDGDERWQSLPVPTGNLYQWDAASTYVQEPPFFKDLAPAPPPLRDLANARVLVMVGDSVTTDHISPAGSIPADRPAGRFLIERGVSKTDFNSFGARRGNHEVMMRGTFGNVRLKNLLTPGKEGDWTVSLPSGEATSIYEAAMRYQREGTPLLVIAGKEYGTGSSRDWAAKGPMLLGIKAAIAESYERIHRSNLVGMGVLPLQFPPGQSAKSLGLTGRETYHVHGIEKLTPGAQVEVLAQREDGSAVAFKATARINSPIELEYYRHGGILQKVLRDMLKSGA